MVRLLVGHTPTHTEQPMQSMGLMAMANLYLPLLSLWSAILAPAGAAAASASLSRKGRMVAWGHTKAHWLHWAQVLASHTGTVTDTPRFS